MGNGATRYKSKILKIYFFNDFMQKLIKQVVSKMLIGSISWRKFVISTQGFFIFFSIKVSWCQRTKRCDVIFQGVTCLN